MLLSSPFNPFERKGLVILIYAGHVYDSYLYKNKLFPFSNIKIFNTIYNIIQSIKVKAFIKKESSDIICSESYYLMSFLFSIMIDIMDIRQSIYLCIRILTLNKKFQSKKIKM